MKLHYLLGTRIPIAATRMILNLTLTCKRLHTYTVSPGQIQYPSFQPAAVVPPIDAVGACGNAIDSLIANDCTMVYNQLGL
jgi:hypothetical protein